MTTPRHYVDNAAFYDAMVEFRRIRDVDPDHPIPEYIGKCILDIATRFASRPNFYGYSYKDELISDAIENCLQYVDNFDPAKSRNPFAYFTQVSFYAFLRRIQREKKQSYIKHKLIQEMPYDAFDVQQHEDADFMNEHMAFLQNNNHFDVEAFEKSLEKKPTKIKSTVIEKLMEEETDDGIGP